MNGVFLPRFSTLFTQLDAGNLDRLGDLYSDKVHFTDPLREICGIAELRRYFAERYAVVTALNIECFAFDEVRKGEGYLRWVMSYRHTRLNGGKPIGLEGCSMLRWNADGKVTRHRDYYDAGALLYQHIPGVDSLIRRLHARMTTRSARP